MSIWTDVQGALRRPLPRIPWRAVAAATVTVLVVAVVIFWQPLARFVGNIQLPNPAPQAVVNPPAVIVPSQTPTLTATPSPTETSTLAPTVTPIPTLTATPTMTPTKTPVTWQEAEAYIGENCMWMTLAEALSAPPEWKTAKDFPQGQAILGWFKKEKGILLDHVSLGAFNGTDLGFNDNNEKWACIFSPSLEEAYVFVNAKGEVEVVPVLP